MMAWTREQKNAYQRALYRKAHHQRLKRGPKPKPEPQKEEEKPILPQTPFSALFTEFFIDRNPKK